SSLPTAYWTLVPVRRTPDYHPPVTRLARDCTAPLPGGWTSLTGQAMVGAHRTTRTERFGARRGRRQPVVQTHEPTATAVPGVLFTEGYVEADGFRIRYREAGQGEPLVSLHGAGGMKLYRSHALLAAQYRVIVFEVPGFGQSPANERSQSMPDLALTMAQAVANLGIERFNLMGNSFGGKLALWLAIQQPERIQALILVAPAAIRPEGAQPPQALSPEELMARLYAHPERQAPLLSLDSTIRAKQQALVRRIMGPPRDQALES